MIREELPLHTPIEDLAYVAFPNNEVKRIVLFLHGRGERDQRSMLYPWEQRVVDAGSVFLYPYYGPWSWVTPTVSKYIDTLVEEVFRQCHQHNNRLADEGSRSQANKIDLIISGGSMGGHAALQHAIHTRHDYLRVFAMAPVTDLRACYDYLPDVRRSMTVGLAGEEGSFADILRRHSPLHCIEDFPQKPVMIFHGTRDEIVPFEDHSEGYYAAMLEKGHAISLHTIDMGHEAVERYGGHDWVRHYFLCEGRSDLSPSAAKQRAVAQGLPQEALST